jgi:hypothetical protein
MRIRIVYSSAGIPRGGSQWMPCLTVLEFTTDTSRLEIVSTLARQGYIEISGTLILTHQVLIVEEIDNGNT